MNLDLGWSQEYNALKYHMQEALDESNLNSEHATSGPSFAIFSKKYYNELCNLNHDKIYDYSFIGSINSCQERRKWVIEFARRYFTSNSIFINTDNNPNWKLLGDFDKSNQNLGFCPKTQQDTQSKKTQYRVIQENLYYFQTMCSSKFVLCPAGDGSWSFRFYETLMCKSIPIVESWHHTYRTKEESNIKYNYILYTTIDQLNNIPYDEFISSNTTLFEKNHLLKQSMSISDLKTHIDLAFQNAENNLSKITNDILNMDGMTGKKTRHFYNNLLNKDDARYLEIGTWKGSSVCSAMYQNNAKVICIDNWSEFDGPKEEFMINFNKYKGINDANFIEQDCFTVNIKNLPKFNIYMYDGNHTSESHNKALVHYYDCLDNTFIFVVDDWNWDYVRNGTFDSFKQLNLTVIYEKEIFTEGNCTTETWWNGIYVAILQKQ